MSLLFYIMFMSVFTIKLVMFMSVTCFNAESRKPTSCP